MVPLRPLPHFIVGHLIYQISPLPSLFSVWFLLLFPSTSGDLFPHCPHYGRSDMVQISRFWLWESSRTLCPFWMLVREPLDHMAKERGLWRAEELPLGVGTSSKPWAEAGVVVFCPSDPLAEWSCVRELKWKQQAHRNVRNFKKLCCFWVTEFEMVCCAAASILYRC